MNSYIEKSSTGHKFSLSGGILVIICFFLPWVLVSCGGASVRLSGIQIAAGSSIGEGYYATKIPGRPVIFLVFLAALGALALGYMAWKRGALQTNLDGYGLIALGVIALLILLMEFSGEKDRANQMGTLYQYQIGIYGVVIGNILLIIGGVVNLKQPPNINR